MKIFYISKRSYSCKRFKTRKYFTFAKDVTPCCCPVILTPCTSCRTWRFVTVSWMPVKSTQKVHKLATKSAIIGYRSIGQFYSFETDLKITVRKGGVKNPKVGKVKMDKQIIYHVTAPMSGPFLKSRFDRSSFAKLP